MNYNFKFCQDIAENVALTNLKATEDAAAKAYRVITNILIYIICVL